MGSSEIMLFGVRVVVDPMRKCVSLNNLSDYEKDDKIIGDENKMETGYASANEAVQISSSRERKRGVPWTEKEHKRFLLGLQKIGKGDWKGISRNYVKTRTPTQVASHAQKYFLRRTNLNRRRRRSSLFDITTDTVTEMPMEQDQVHHAQDNNASLPQTNISSAHQHPFHPTHSSSNLVQFVPVTVEPKPAFSLNNTDAQLSLNLSLSSSSNSRHSAFAMMPSFSHGDSSSSIRVA